MPRTGCRTGRSRRDVGNCGLAVTEEEKEENFYLPFISKTRGFQFSLLVTRPR